MTPDETIGAITRFLASVSTLGLATLAEDGSPHACNVNFVQDDYLNLYFISSPGSAHGQHIARHPAAAAAAYLPFSSPAEIKGVQMRGFCHIVTTDAEFETIWEKFKLKFPYATAMEARARSEKFYRFRPQWCRWIDNSVHFGFKSEIELPAE